MPRKKKLKREDIKKNTSTEVSHTINKIKENERKYTIILVIMFILLFIVIGYYSLRVTNDTQISNYNKKISTVTSNGEVITLTSKNIMTDIEGLKSKRIVYKLENNSGEDIEYKVILNQDKNYTDICNCADRIINNNYIRYTTDDKVIKTLGEDRVIYEGKLSNKCSKTIKLRVWVDEAIPTDKDYHFHGYLEIE